MTKRKLSRRKGRKLKIIFAAWDGRGHFLLPFRDWCLPYWWRERFRVASFICSVYCCRNRPWTYWNLHTIKVNGLPYMIVLNISLLVSNLKRSITINGTFCSQHTWACWSLSHWAPNVAIAENMHVIARVVAVVALKSAQGVVPAKQPCSVVWLSRRRTPHSWNNPALS